MGKDNRYYGKILVFTTVSIFLTITILSSILYFSFERIALDQSYDQTMNSLEQTTQEASVMAVTAATFAKQIYSDQHIANLLNFPDIGAVDIDTAVKQMTNYRESSPFIDSIYVYNAISRTFFVSSDMSVPTVFAENEFYDNEMREMLSHLNDYETLMPIPRRLLIDGLVGNIAEKERDTYTFLLYDTLTQNARKNVVVVNIKETQLHKHIDGSLANDASNTFLIDKEGRLVSNSWTHPMLMDMKGTSYIDRVVNDRDESGYFSEQVDGVKSLVTYTAPDYLGWRYIRIIPYSTITESIDSMRLKTILTGGSILLAGLALSYVASRRLFHGLNKKLLRLGNLEEEWRDSFQKMRTAYLRGLLSGDNHSDAEQARKIFDRYNIGLNPSDPMRVILFTIDDYRHFISEYSVEDRKLLRYGILNIGQELLHAGGYVTAAVDLGDDRVAILAQCGLSEEEGDCSTIRKDAAEIQTAVSLYLKLSVTISASMTGSGVESVHRLCQQAIEASFNRLFNGPGSFVDAETVERMKERPYEYPLHKEKQLIDELMLGRIPEVKRLFHEIVGETAEYSYMSFQLAITHVSHALQNAIRVIGQHSSKAGEPDVPLLNLYMHERMESMAELNERFMALFDRLEKHMEEKKKTRQDDMPGRIKRMVDERYADPNLSLDMIAEELGMSATYIGRIFKQHTFQTILGYIHEVRMNRVRELLIASDDSIGDIAEQAGFANNPYFYKAFKKHNGVTPAEFRKAGRLQQDGEQLAQDGNDADEFWKLQKEG
ncbi:helix-turn-helix domain-containing protein [Paenibacillus gorillae]|uniref:helix-turn-helix domain-containing protein n=1 Tax=Paenibacillus gorillae TaxID=1243662 RepID=UPI0004B9413D|nr:helix-turn-helix domain-containing protein [Paenibacillus gorillae]